MKITSNIKNIILQGEATELGYKLPDIKLDRKEYLEVNEVLEAIGLKWNKGKKQHTLSEPMDDIMEVLQDICDRGEVETLKEYRDKYQFFETPEAMVDEMISWLDLKPSDYVLEPSAGLGAIARKLKAIHEPSKIKLVELDKKKADILRQEFENVSELDFLELHTSYEKIIMNPPFNKNQYIKHILHAYNKCLEPKGVIVAIAPNSIKNKDDKLHQEFRNIKNVDYYDLPQGSFKDSGTLVNTCIVRIIKD